MPVITPGPNIGHCQAPELVDQGSMSTRILFLVIFLFADGLYQAEAVFKYEIVDWNAEGQSELQNALNKVPNVNRAKNVILFLGDGNGVSNTGAARILKGQLNGKSGEETRFTYETFPYVALSKTYNTDHQVPDSAGTATAFLCGVKARYGTMGVNQHAVRGNCSSRTGNEVTSILHWSQAEGKSTGLVTNTRITHATPGAAYSHIVDRTWESDSKVPAEARGKCEDIASQLVTKNTNINVIMGGARIHFLPNTTVDLGDPTKNGTRADGRNLIDEWVSDKQRRNLRHKFVWNRDQLNTVDPVNTDYIMGLFATSHMEYEELRCSGSTCIQPSLVEMTEKAINILKKNAKGYFLLVEGGRIDHSHHDGKAKKAFTETIQFDDAVQKAVQMTSEKDTLIVVTADHSHVMSFGGYPTRGNPILGLENYETTLDDLPFTTIMYGNGPGYVKINKTTGMRPNWTEVDTTQRDFKQPAAIPLAYESHAGEDVAIYARGPMAHLFHGVHEQNYIAHVMAYASCVGRNKAHCSHLTPKFCTVCPVSGTGRFTVSPTLISLILITLARFFQ